MSKKGKPTVYLLHFDSPIAHAQHYLGWSCFLDGRLADHRAGRGARLPQVFAERGIAFRLVRQWPGGRTVERALKRLKSGPLLCPLCAGSRSHSPLGTRIGERTPGKQENSPPNGGSSGKKERTEQVKGKKGNRGAQTKGGQSNGQAT